MSKAREGDCWKQSPSKRMFMSSPALIPPAVVVLEKRYLKRDTEGRVVESPEEMFTRVARNIAEAERMHKSFISHGELEENFLTIIKGTGLFSDFSLTALLLMLR